MNKKISSLTSIFIIVVIGSLATLYLIKVSAKVGDITSSIEFNNENYTINVEDKEEEVIRALVCSENAGTSSVISNGDYLRASSTSLDNSNLSITGSKKEGFNFKIDTINYNAHIGGVEGSACITQVKDTYLFSDNDQGEGSAICKMSFSFSGDNVSIQNTTACSDYGGANVYFDGQYIKDAKVVEFNVSDILNLKTDKQKQVFVTMVGKNLKLFDGWTGEDVATTTSGQVIWQNGSQGYGYSSIIVVQGDSIWAVAKDYDEKDGTNLVRYFTNVESDKKGMPHFLSDAISESGGFFMDDAYLVFESAKGEPRVVF